MARQISPEMKKDNQRKIILLVIIGVLLIAILILGVYMLFSSDTEKISHTSEVNYSAKNSSLSGGDKTLDKANCKFKEDSITVAVGKSVTPEIEGGCLSDLENWKSEDTKVASVDDKGKITGESIGLAALSAQVKGTDTLLTIRVKVVPEKEEETTNAAEDETKSEESKSGQTSYGEPVSKGTTPNGFEIIEDNGKTYIDGILMASKTYTLPADYAPGEDPEMLSAFSEMSSAAAAEGLDIHISSGFRSYEDQERIYYSYVEQDGKEAADTYSSRPGHSDHQTGLAIDLNSIDDSFGATPESDWVKVNAHKYGFIIRYPEGKEAITGYQYEPWHLRYIGVDKATAVYESGLSLEEYLGVTSDYADCETE